MGDYRSKPYGDEGKMRRESYYGHKPSSKPNHFRSQTFSLDSSSSAAYAYGGGPPQAQPNESSFGHKPNSNVPNHLIRSQSAAYDFSYAYGVPAAQQSNESYYGYNNKPNSKPNIHSRSQSVSSSYDSSSYYYYAHGGGPQQNQIVAVKDLKLQKSKSTSGVISKSSWGLSDPEFQRKKRVASYKVYSVEGKVKGSLKKSFKWVKDRYTQVVNGWW